VSDACRHPHERRYCPPDATMQTQACGVCGARRKKTNTPVQTRRGTRRLWGPWQCAGAQVLASLLQRAGSATCFNCDGSGKTFWKDVRPNRPPIVDVCNMCNGTGFFPND
jgi:hypothetical protein